MGLRSVPPSPEQLKFRDEMLDLLKKYGHLDGIKLVTIVSYTLGQMIAFQDQTKYKPDQVMALVAENVEAGNKHAIEHTFQGAKRT